MVTRSQVQLAEVASTLELIEKLVHHWNRKLVLDGVLAEGTIVNAEAL
jgi:hypothetical protein